MQIWQVIELPWKSLEVIKFGKPVLYCSYSYQRKLLWKTLNKYKFCQIAQLSFTLYDRQNHFGLDFFSMQVSSKFESDGDFQLFDYHCFLSKVKALFCMVLHDARFFLVHTCFFSLVHPSSCAHFSVPNLRSKVCTTDHKTESITIQGGAQFFIS